MAILHRSDFKLLFFILLQIKEKISHKKVDLVTIYNVSQ